MSRLPIDYVDEWWYKPLAVAPAKAVESSSSDDDENESDDDSSDYSDFSDGEEDTEYCVVEFSFYRGNDGELVVKELSVCVQSLKQEES